MTNNLKKRIGRVIAMSIGLFLILLVWYGYAVGQFRYQIHGQTMYFEDLPPQFDGYKIVQFSDLHIGTLLNGHEEKARVLVDLINSQNADAIMFTGDMVNRSSREVETFDCTLSKLKAKDGVYSVLGNHDYAMYSRAFNSKRERRQDAVNLVNQMKSFGWKPMINENVRIRRGAGSIVVAGVENSGYSKLRFPRFARLDKALKGTSDKDFVILLSHDPTHWRKEVLPKSNVQLTLSGHTHAAQFRIGSWSPSKYVYDEWSGVYMEGKQVLNVSEGCGSLIPFRIGAWPEINVITLRKVKK